MTKAGTSSVAAKHRTYGPLRQRSSFSTLQLACTNEAENRYVGNTVNESTAPVGAKLPVFEVEKRFLHVHELQTHSLIYF